MTTVFGFRGPRDSRGPATRGVLTGLFLGLALVAAGSPLLAETCHRDSNGDFICCDNSGVCYRRDQ